MTASPTPNARRKTWLFIARLGVAAVLMALLIITTGWDAIVGIFQTAHLTVVLAVGVGLILLVLLGACNVWLVLNTLHALPFAVFLKDYVYAWAASLITPGQAGDASIILFLKRHQVPMRVTGVSYLVDKMMTLAVFAVIAWYGCMHLIPKFKGLWLLIFAAGFVALPALLITLRSLPVRAPWLVALQQRIDASLLDLGRLGSKWPVLIVNGVLTTVKWLVVSGVFYTAFRSINVIVGWPDIGVIPILSTLVGYIPVSIAGIGTVEVSATYLFGIVGVDPAAVVSAYLLLRSLQYLIAGILMLLAAAGTWQKKRNAA
jgi:uncharacterized membrane protein YbhN (UPF0104 family)